MESNGKKGYVHVSEETKKLLEEVYQDQYEFHFNSTINLNSIQREIKGYFVEIVEDEIILDEDD